jgi:hypothetical protein
MLLVINSGLNPRISADGVIAVLHLHGSIDPAHARALALARLYQRGTMHLAA